ncbi:MAG: Jag N-terminal domain-containing protein [Anaerolineaceae bacterium]|nr:Jag N-terminal domain-containing protein [Anaerolineaceae bacterium]
MSAEHTIEITGDSVDEAVAKGLAQLGVGPGDVIVEVLEEPSRGMFGLGARPARVRLKLFKPPAPPAAPPPPKPAAKPASKPVDKPAAKAVDRHADDKDAEDTPLLTEMVAVVDESQMVDDARAGRSILMELLGKMGLPEAVVTVYQPLDDDSGEDNPWLLDVSGPNLNALIGRRGETLASLQYITRLIASRELQHRANIVVDVSGYKSRRSQMLRDLANRMANQAVQSNRVVTLEPMPPYERRIIHLTLRSRDDVQTKSVGEGDSRKVTIVPKN